MGFFSKLKKALPYVEKGAVIAGQVQGNPVGSALSVVDLILNKGRSDVSSASVPVVQGQLINTNADAVRAVAVAVDDHEHRLVSFKEDGEVYRRKLAELDRRLIALEAIKGSDEE